MTASQYDLKEIVKELADIDYGELHIIVRGSEIVSYTTIKSNLKQRPSNIKSNAESQSPSKYE